jgi:hypothetical protein
VQQDLAADMVAMIVSAVFNRGSTNGLPLPDANRLYTVFLPPNVTFTATGANGTTYSSANYLTGWNDSFSMGGAQIHYVVIPYPGGTNVNGQGNLLDAITESLSHEIAEAVTGQQIGDNTQMYHFRMSNGVAIQEVGEPYNFGIPIPVAGATRLPF